jgi:hypothetical protein
MDTSVPEPLEPLETTQQPHTQTQPFSDDMDDDMDDDALLQQVLEELLFGLTCWFPLAFLGHRPVDLRSFHPQRDG